MKIQEALHKAIKEQLNDEEIYNLERLERLNEGQRAWVEAAKENPADLGLEALAWICDAFLAWDSLSFLDVLDVPNDGDIRAEPTNEGFKMLKKLNGGKRFKYPLDGWST